MTSSTKLEAATPLRVLLVAENPADVKLVRAMLDTVRNVLRLSILQARDLEEALRIQGRESQDVVLLDFHAPGVGGLDGVERLQRETPGLPVLLLVDDAKDCSLSAAFQRGARDLLVKDHLDAHLLARAVQHAAERRRARELLRQRRSQLERYQSVLVQLSKSDDSNLDDSLRRLLETDARTLGVERASIWLYTEDRSAITCRLLFQLSKGTFEGGTTLKASDYPRYFESLDSSRVIPASDAREDPRTREFRDGYLVPLGIHSMLDVPIRLHGRFMGIVCHEHTGPVREWAPEDQEFGSAIADLVALAFASEERRRAEESLREERNLVSTILDTAGMLVVVLDPAGRILRINRACEHVLRWTSAEAAGRGFWDLYFTPEDAAQVREAFRTGQGDQAEHSWVTKDGIRPRIAWSRASIPNPDGSVKVHVVTGIDITERKSLEDQLIHDAFHDALTGLPNRALFMDRLGQSLRHAVRRKDTPFAVFFLDLDRFKIVNDSLGHMVGDQMLVEVARRLEASVRPGDTAARLGGDEFTVLVDDVKDAADAQQIAERIQQQLRAPMTVGGQEVVAAASMGVALSELGYERPEDILRDADIAMYRAKQKGGGRLEVFDRTMHARAVELLRMETDLRRAIERKEFVVHYQPIVSLRDGRISGFEALVRWNHPHRGLLLPGEFIRMAEETGLVIDIDRWVLRESCRQLQDWHRRFPTARPLSVTVNASSRQFSQADFSRHVEAALRSTGLHGECLGLEITESILMDASAQTNGILEDLRRSGARLYLDDFGTGYSSLSYLHKFPVDALKIDRSFVGSMKADGEGQEIVKTILSLAQNLDLHVVAEGVETGEQLQILRSLRCEYAQGWAFSKAVAGGEAEEMLASGRRWR
jgi:diguanylate cyclase (GGDEF)-like protein/PAS domain S-box-containing protein